MRLRSAVMMLLAGMAFAAPAKLRTASMTFASGKTIRVELAVTPQEHQIGLMFRTSLPKDYGMLFVFPGRQRLQFWMKNTWTDLDMIFIGEDKRITAIYRNVPRSFPETPEAAVARRSADGQYVLELAAGESVKYRLKKGDKLNFQIDVEVDRSRKP